MVNALCLSIFRPARAQPPNPRPSADETTFAAAAGKLTVLAMRTFRRLMAQLTQQAPSLPSPTPSLQAKALLMKRSESLATKPSSTVQMTSPLSARGATVVQSRR